MVGLGALLTVPETVHVRRPGRLMELGLPPEARRPFWAVLAPTALGVFAFPTVAATLLPLLVVADGVGVAYAGLIAGLSLAASAVAARVGRRADRGAGPLGMVFGALGLAIGVAAVLAGSEPLLLPASVLMGAGGGLCLTAGLTLTARLAPPQARGAATAAITLLCAQADVWCVRVHDVAMSRSALRVAGAVRDQGGGFARVAP